MTLPVTLRGIAIVKETFLFHRNPGPDNDKWDWHREEGPNLSDPRTAGPQCNGAHRPMAPGRGSKSGSNGHGKWTVCEVCLLRLSYVPAVGAKAIYRSAGPLPQDVKEAVETGQEDLTTKGIGIQAAEKSLLARLEKVQKYVVPSVLSMEGILPRLIGIFSHYLQGLHLRWVVWISSINSWSPVGQDDSQMTQRILQHLPWILV